MGVCTRSSFRPNWTRPVPACNYCCYAGHPPHWGAVLSFCEAVMRQKETAERNRQRTDAEHRQRRQDRNVREPRIAMNEPARPE